MMKKYLRIGALIVAIVLIIGVGWLVNDLVGNPVSKLLAKNSAISYVEEHYEEKFKLDSVNYSFKDHCYYAHMKKDNSKDYHFSIKLDRLGHVLYSNYDNIKDLYNTASRLNEQYRRSVEVLFKDYDVKIGYGELDIRDSNASDLPPYYIDLEELEIDREYDINLLAKRAGHLIVYIDDKDLSAKRCSEALRDIKQMFDDSHIAFKSINLSLRNDKDYYSIRYFDYSDIDSKDFVDKVITNKKATDEYYKKQDSLKESNT